MGGKGFPGLAVSTSSTRGNPLPKCQRPKEAKKAIPAVANSPRRKGDMVRISLLPRPDIADFQSSLSVGATCLDRNVLAGNELRQSPGSRRASVSHRPQLFCRTGRMGELAPVVIRKAGVGNERRGGLPNLDRSTRRMSARCQGGSRWLYPKGLSPRVKLDGSGESCIMDRKGAEVKVCLPR